MSNVYESIIQNIPERYVQSLKTEIDQYKTVNYSTFVLRNRQIIKKNSRNYLINYFDKDIGDKLQHYIQNKQLTLGRAKFIVMKVLKFCQYLKSLNLNFTKQLEQNIFIKEIAQGNIEVYFTNIDFTFDIDANNIYHFQKNTLTVGNIDKDSHMVIMNSSFSKLLNCLKKRNKEIISNSYFYRLIQRFYKVNFSPSQLLQYLSQTKIQLGYRVMRLRLNEIQNQKVINFEIYNKITKQYLINQIKESQINQNLINFVNIQTLFCELSMIDNSKVYLSDKLNIIFPLNGCLQEMNFSRQWIDQNNQNISLEVDNIQTTIQQLLKSQLKQNNHVKNDDRQYPFNCLVKISAKFNESQIQAANKYILKQQQRLSTDNIGTGSLISPRIVLTCAHVVCNKKLKQKNISQSAIIQIDNRNIVAEQIVIPPLYFSYMHQYYNNNDYALLYLSQPVKRKQYLKIATNYKAEDNIYTSHNPNFNYKIGIAHLQGYYSELLKFHNQFIYHYLESQKRQCGSPIFIQLNNNPKIMYIIGLHTNTTYNSIQSNTSSQLKRGVKITQKIAKNIIKYQHQTQIDKNYIQIAAQFNMKNQIQKLDINQIAAFLLQYNIYLNYICLIFA